MRGRICRLALTECSLGAPTAAAMQCSFVCAQVTPQDPVLLCVLVFF
jgi:hypothetical protein